MRQVVPLDLPDVSPADLTGMAQPDFDLVDPRELLVDDAYQRNLSPKSAALIRRIVEGFRWSKFKPPICVRIDGRLHVLDGLHTAIAAATHPGIRVIPVVVVDEPRTADRAKAFVSHARDRLAATPGQIWRAEVAAGDEDALTIQQVCVRAGVTLLPFAPSSAAYKPGETIALGAIRGLLARRGAMRTREVLEALGKADLAPVTGDMIKAAEALLCEDEYRSEFDPDKIAASIKALGPRALSEAKELAAAKGLPLWRALVATIFKHRKGRTSNAAKAISLTRCAARPPEPAVFSHGDPPPGRSALDLRRAGA
jgi:hypothetical protein